MSDDNQITEIIDVKNIKKLNGIAKYIHSPLSYKLQSANLALFCISNTENIRSGLLLYGYDTQKFAEFKLKYEETVKYQSLCQKKIGDRGEVYFDFLKLFEIAKKTFTDTVKITKIAIKKDPVKLSQLGVSSRARRDYAGVFHNMQNFYNNMLKSEEIMQAMSVFGYSVEKINGLRDAFIAVRTAYSNYLEADSAYRATVALKNQKAAELDRFMLDLFTVAKIAFGKDAQELKLLGLD